MSKKRSAELEMIIESKYEKYFKVLTPEAKRSRSYASTLSDLTDFNLSENEKKAVVKKAFDDNKMFKKLGIKDEYSQGAIDSIMFLKKYNNKKGKNIYGKKIK